ncbi:MAG: 4-demethylwyosine synthase TYW1 [Candidatus Methanoplasma sp.]|jgi:tRNA wybutosine-synthesizing protein 1|nr:4-demethylwyosine synthase TYW1 [Candidatus Methanoplasma sp.]
MDEGYRDLLARQQYRLCGDHAAVKLCHWLKESLVRGRHCYKQDFYGIESHRCLQITPAINECSHRCSFCWRVQDSDFEVTDWMEPREMLDSLIAHQRLLISGFKGDPRCSGEMFEEACDPNQVAISLAGEPITYPHLSELLRECRRRGMTTFLVTNGTYPERLEALDVLPTQTYVTVAAPDEETYRAVCRPKIPDGWERLMRTLEILPSLGTRTVIRHTLVKGLNMGREEGYAKLDRIADPYLIEPKGYVFVGASRQRLSLASMPSFGEIRSFSERLGEMVGMEVLKEREDSRVLLLGRRGAETDVRRLAGTPSESERKNAKTVP